MNRRMRVITFAMVCGLVVCVASAAEDAPEFLDAIEDKDQVLEGEMAEAPAGDKKEFTVVTDTDVSTLTKEDIYKSKSTFFKVIQIRSKGTEGGELVVERVKGESDPGRKWTRVSGLGPLSFDSRETLLDRFLSGGPLMYPIAFLLLVLIIIALNSAWIYRRGKQAPRRFVEAAQRALDDGDVGRFGELAADEKGLFARVCCAMASKFDTSTTEDINIRCQAEAKRQISVLRVPLKGLNFIASVAPLLGLLGTVIGMIICFDSLSGDAASEAKSQAMAGGIKVALLTTAAGLSVAAPALLVFFVFNQRLNMIISHCETLAGDFVHELAVVKRGTGFQPVVESEHSLKGCATTEHNLKGRTTEEGIS